MGRKPILLQPLLVGMSFSMVFSLLSQKRKERKVSSPGEESREENSPVPARQGQETSLYLYVRDRKPLDLP